MGPRYRAQFEEPAASDWVRAILYQTFHGKTYLAVVRPPFVGSEREITLFLTERNAPVGTIWGWSESNGMLLFPESILQSATTPTKGEAFLVGDALFQYHIQHPNEPVSIFVWHDSPTLARERHRTQEVYGRDSISPE